MIPTGAVIPGAMVMRGVTLAELFVPVSVLAMFVIVAALVVIVAGVARSYRASVALKRSCSPREPASPPARQEPRHAA